MQRSDYIQKVKAKLEEISSFSDPSSLQVLGDGESELVKPIISYIEDSLDEAAHFCLDNLPTTLLASDMEEDEYSMPIGLDGVGRISGIDEYVRLVRVRVLGGAWERDVTEFITPSSPLYVLQQNRYTRGKSVKPVVAYVPERSMLELYSFPPQMRPEDCCDYSQARAKVYYINTHKKAEKVSSLISEFIVLRCAAIVLEILKDNNAEVMMTEYANKLNDILK